jgi:urease accessory protein
MRGTRPFVFTNMKKNQGVRDIAKFIMDNGGLPERNLLETL